MSGVVFAAVANVLTFETLASVAFVLENWPQPVKSRESKKHLGNMYTDILIRVKNATLRSKEKVKVPYSRLSMDILESLVKRGYIVSAVRKGRGIKRIIDVELGYNDGKSNISDIKFWSRPSRKLYIGYKNIKKAKQGYGHFFLSTPKGILTGEEARKQKVGGEILFEIW